MELHVTDTWGSKAQTSPRSPVAEPQYISKVKALPGYYGEGTRGNKTRSCIGPSIRGCLICRSWPLGNRPIVAL